MNFGSDNTSGIHPKVMEALIAANEGHARSYGADDWTARAIARVREVFEAPEAEVWLMASGTATNALSLAAVSKPWGKIFCHKGAHIETSECNAVPFYTGGADLVTVPGYHGRIAPGALSAALEVYGRRDVHAGVRSALSLTNSTEAGTIYTPEAVARLAGIARQADMVVHMDGARLANALVALQGCRPAGLTHRVGVDILSLGGTKNGGLAIEAVVVFDPACADDLGMRRMRGGQLWSKHRFLAAQMLALLQDDLWLSLGAHANAMATRLGNGLTASGITLDHPVEANQVFAAVPCHRLKRAREAGLVCFDWPFTQSPDVDPHHVRLVCGWATTESEVDAAIKCLR